MVTLARAMMMAQPKFIRRAFDTVKPRITARALMLCASISLSISLVGCGNKATIVLLDTQMGQIEIEVYEDKAPKTAADFLYYVDNGLYEGQGFYRTVWPQTDQLGQGLQIIQGGRLDLQRLSGEIELESTVMSGLTHKDGAVGIVRNADANSGSAAFFYISIGENKILDHGGERVADGQGLALFGQVVSGMDVVSAIQNHPVLAGTPQDPTLSQYMVEPVLINQASRK